MNRLARYRLGAVAPLFAFLLPVMFVLSGFAINLAYMQLVSSELKIATDCSAHAGGRAMSISQSTNAAVAKAIEIANLNQVGRAGLQLTVSDSDEDITFGRSLRGDGGFGRYEFTGYSQQDVDNGVHRANSFAIEGHVQVPFMFASIPGMTDPFDIRRRSIATQVDRDIALVLDRSGSMLYYENETALTAALWDLYNTYEDVVVSPGTDGYWRYGWWGYWYGWYWVGYASFDEANSWGWSYWYYYDPNDRYWVDGDPPVTESERLITLDEYNDATEFLYDRRYSQNVIDQLATINNDMSEYAADWQTMINSSNSWSTRTPAPRHSRWAFLIDGVDAFLNVLEATDQDELVCLVTFNNSATLDLTLQTSYDSIRTSLEDRLPYDGTAIGDGMLLGHPEVVDGSLSRLFAAKTIVVLSDGESNSGTDPVTAASQIVTADAVTIHTVTFATDNQDAKDDMEEVASTGNGKHYHADDGNQLIDKFVEIANNLPTILSE